MAFAIVKFTSSDEVAIVPVNWLRGDKCLWPPKQLAHKLSSFIEKSITASEAWEDYPIQTLGVYVTFKEARAKLKVAEEKSDLNTTDDENCGRGKRQKWRRRLSSSSDLADLSSELEYPILNCPVLENDIQESSFTLATEKNVDCEVNSESLLKSIEETNVCNMAPSMSEMLLNSSKVMKLHSTPANISESLLKSNKANLCSTSSNTPAFQRFVLKELQLIKMNQKVIMETLDGIANSLNHASASANNKENFNLIEDIIKLLPASNETNLQLIEKNLNDENSFNQMTYYLSRIGGGSVEQGLKLILKRVLSDEMASTYSFMGFRKKKSFQMTNMFKVVIGAVRQNNAWKSTSERDLEKVVSNWLRHAKGRIQQKKLHLFIKE